MHTIAIGCDPNAAEAKQGLIAFLEKKGYSVTDFGSDDPIYANVAVEVAKAVAAGQYDRGVLICGTGIGVSLAANKVKGAYAALLADVYSAERARKSNDCNIACFGAFTLGIMHMKRLTEEFLTSEFEPGCASQPKVDRIRKYEC
ncbi:RpiB/LacA/LacB family sugar-phosphate isomerase [Bacillota bacterium Meth-B3]|nr:RpiB/LacA/LacB family sugar-phosphate isomerase [Christensenellaceae bacterium]MEA5065244.1 RpiB/LacA/LacB family sugar-phosphate isomerase [Eubacteriales bacterium]MEA5069142.1 RpiB/LacA/LacB family sugar-phosphate isomerase [Christensenellaceae bacterium]